MFNKLRSAVILMFLGITMLQAQVTTSTINGLVTDAKGAPLTGATLIATHQPSGTVYGVTTRSDGRFTLPNVRVGGPYVLKASFVGYKTEQANGIYLELGQKLVQNFSLSETNANASVEIVANADGILNATRTGASTTVNADVIRNIPTISRNTSDISKLNPMAAEGGSFGGRNDQFNNYSLDGAIFNNPFGLDAATPGGQADASPISLDAIEQINVSIAPYDVTQAGFTGASVNAVTKSGTNQFSGTVFGYFRNKNMIGTKVAGTEVTRGDLSQLQSGFSIGGPIVKDKLFFFANLELERRSDLGSYFIANSGAAGANVSRVLASDLTNISNLLKSQYGYDTGAFENFKHDTNNQKGIFKLDWNVTKRSKLTAMVNFLDAFKDKPAHPSAIGRRGPDFQTLQFANSGYRINNKLYGGVVELKSIFGNRASNKFQAGYTAFRDSREPFSAPFPVLNISKDGVRYIVAGHEPFSINNVLDQDVFQINDNFTLYLNNHTVTLGGSLERFDFNNSFNLTGYGSRVFFPDVDIKDAPALIKSSDFAKEVADARAAAAAGNWALAETNLGQLAFYGQDEWNVNNRLTLTLGLRADMPLYFDTVDKMEESIKRNCCYDSSITYYNEAGQPVKLDSKVFPKQTPLISPRFGFNYDVKGDRSVQVRGGSGLFTGRLPFVWIGNQVANPNFFFYCVTDPDFKFPQVWRTNIGYDQKLGDGWIGSLDVVYTKDINSMMVRNYGLKLPTGKLSGADTRPIYLATDRAQAYGAATNAYVFSNTEAGYTFNTSLQLEKSWSNGMYIKLGYNYLNAMDAASIDAEISSDAYDRNPANINHTNTANLAPSLYGNRNRFLFSASKRFKTGTTVSLFGEMVEGGRFSYTYSGDINNDGSGLNDLVFVPTDAQIDASKFSGTTTEQAAQKAALKAYITQDDYLSGRRGQYAEKYGALSPWYSHIDLRVMQEIKLAGKSVQATLDVLNLGNMINNKWGVREAATYTGLAQPIGVSVTGGVPTYSFDTTQKTTFYNDFSLLSRWQLQLGLRFSF
jgi:hypothetical protein